MTPVRDGTPLARQALTRALAALGARSRFDWLRPGLQHAFESGPRDAQPPVVFLHGLSGDSEPWVLFSLALSERTRGLVPDLFDLGPRSRPERPWLRGASVGARAESLIAWLRTLGADRFDVVGVSLGAWIGLLAASKAPDLIRRLILVSPAGTRRSPDELLELARCATPEHAPRLLRAALAPGTRTAAELALGLAPFAAIRRQIAAIVDDDFIEPHLPRVQARVFVLCGDQDHVVGRHTAQCVVDRVADARGAWVPGIGHGLLYERPGQVYRALARELGHARPDHSRLGRWLLAGAHPRSLPAIEAAT